MGSQKIRLGDYCEIIKGGIGIKKAIPGKYPLVVTAEKRLSHNEYQFDEPAVIIPLVSSTGHGHASIKRIHYQEGKFALGTILCAVLIKDSLTINPKFLHIYLSYFKEYLLVPLMKGAANVTLSIKKIKEVEIILPTYERQLEIIKLEKNSELVKNLEIEIEIQKSLVSKLQQSFLQEAIEGKLTQTWRTKNPNVEPASKLLERIKAEKTKLIKEKKIKKEKPLPKITKDEIPFELPVGWVWCRLGELYEIVRGSSPRPKGDPRYWAKDRTNYHWIKIADFKPFNVNGYLTDTQEFLTDLGKTKSRFVKQTDLLVAASGVGSVGKSIKLGIEGYIYDGIMAIRNILNDDIRNYLQIYLKYKELQIYSVATGANWLNINTTLLKNYIVPLPPLKEIKDIINISSTLKEKINALEQEIKNSETHAQMLMQAVLKEAFEAR